MEEREKEKSEERNGEERGSAHTLCDDAPVRRRFSGLTAKQSAAKQFSVLMGESHYRRETEEIDRGKERE